MRKKQVVVIGSSDDTEHSAEAEQIGRFIARMGWALITGGRGGIMAAASKGASAENGIVIGILPGDDFHEANSYCTIVIPTGIGYARNSVNILSGDVIISIGGKTGTLTEIGYTWLSRKPLISCTFSGGWSRRLSREPVDDRYGLLYPAESLEEVYELLKQILEVRDDSTSEKYGDS